MVAQRFPNLIVLDHPLIQHKLTLLRDRHTTTRDFKQLVTEISVLMGYEVTKDLPTEPHEIETPLERMVGTQVAGKKLVLVPILRAGLGMVDGLTQLVPSARVGHIGMVRDHETLQPRDYYFKVPATDDARDFFVLDPMLATGGSGVAAVTALKAAGATPHPVPLHPGGTRGRRADGLGPSRRDDLHRGARPATEREGLHSSGAWGRGRSTVRDEVKWGREHL